MKKNLSSLLGIMLILVMAGCRPRITPLPLLYEEYKNDSKYTAMYDRVRIYEYILVDHYPRDTAALIRLMVACRDSLGKSIDSLRNVKLGHYAMNFYKNNWYTRRFITHKSKEYKPQGDGINKRENDYIGSVLYYPCDKVNVPNDFWMVIISLNLGDSESFEYAGYNTKDYVIRNDYDSIRMQEHP